MSSSGGGGIIESATAPTGTEGMIWRNGGEYKAYLGGEWQPLTYYDGDKAQVCIDVALMEPSFVPYLSDDYLVASHDTGFGLNDANVGPLTHPLQRGQYVELFLSNMDERGAIFYFGFYSRAICTHETEGVLLWRCASMNGYYPYLYYDDSHPLYGVTVTSETAKPYITVGVSRNASDQVHFYANGVDQGLVNPTFLENLAGWFPTVLGGSGSYSYLANLYEWRVDAADMQYLPDGFVAINEQTP